MSCTSEGEGAMVAAIEALWGCDELPGSCVVRGDDCGVVRIPGLDHDLLVTVDQIVEGAHFVWERHDPGDLGRKALVRSLSDIAAMGGWPTCLVQTVCLPDRSLDGQWHERFQGGLRQAAIDGGVPDLDLVGGDIAKGERFVATVTLIGRIERGRGLLRSGARAGDGIFVSGPLGGSGLGLRRLLGDARPDPRDPAIRRHCAPRARLSLGRRLSRIPATAAIDISDGLGVDLGRLAAASGFAAVIEEASIPLYPGVSREDALSSGEEYELLFTLAPGAPLPEGRGVAQIGQMEPGSGAWLVSSAGRRPIDARGFAHFSNR